MSKIEKDLETGPHPHETRIVRFPAFPHRHRNLRAGNPLFLHIRRSVQVGIFRQSMNGMSKVRN